MNTKTIMQQSMLLTILIVTWLVLPSCPSIVKAPGHSNGGGNVLHDSPGIDSLQEFLNELTEAEANRWLREFNKELDILRYKEALGQWLYETNMTDENAGKMEKTEKLFIQWSEKQQPKAKQYYHHFKRCNSGLAPCRPRAYNISYALKTIVNSLSIPSPRDPLKRDELLHICSQMTAIYSKGKITKDGKSYQIEPELTKLLAESRDYDELLWAWEGWRNVTGRNMRDIFLKSVELQNEGAQNIGLPDIGVFKRISNYDMDTELEETVDKLFAKVMPIYSQLHAYVRRKLIEKYPDNGIDPNGPIPAHLLGNMWAQQWNNIYDLLVPYPDIDPIDVTAAMVDQGYDPIKMFKTAESFYTSLGLFNMTPTFWAKSMIVKPTDGRQVVCHASANDLSIGDDYRIKMCTEVTQEYLKTIHHEMGHIEYYMLYRSQPPIYRGGANAAFHEAIGDTIALSVMTPGHLSTIGLLNPTDKHSLENTRKRDINALMMTALFKIAFLPFGYLIDKYRWAIYRGNITEQNLNSEWWHYRIKYQGVSPPVNRSEEDFDAGAKYHVPADVPYIRYFLSFIGQFQFHKSLCETAGQYGELHNCDIYGSKEAGEKLREALSLGCSRPWKDVMQVLTGGRSFDISAMEEYFGPLLEWLKDQNVNENIGWKGQYKDDSPENDDDLNDLDVQELLRRLIAVEEGEDQL